MSVGVLDHAGLVRAFQQIEGRRFLGVVDCNDCFELVFEDLGGTNLVTFFMEGRHTGLVAFGGVAEPETYVEGWREWNEAA